MQGYNGYKVVGQFSTDNQQSDEMQIAEEQGPDDPLGQEDEYYDDEFRFLELEEDDIQVTVFVGCSESPDWWTTGLISDSVDEENAFNAKALEEHNQECPCGDPSNFVSQRLSN